MVSFVELLLDCFLPVNGKIIKVFVMSLPLSLMWTETRMRQNNSVMRHCLGLSFIEIVSLIYSLVDVLTKLHQGFFCCICFSVIMCLLLLC